MKKLLRYFLFFILCLSAGNSFSQNVTGDNYEIRLLDDNCQCGFYISYFSNYLCNDHPTVWGPSPRDFNFKFGVKDSSMITISVFSHNNTDTILTARANLKRGCYYIDWISQNLVRLNSGMYFFSLEAEPYSKDIENFKGIKKIVLIK